MIINKSQKKKRFLPMTAAALSISVLCATAAMASGTSTASIRPGKSTATGSTVTASGTTGSLKVSSAGPTFYVQGYAKREIDFWPDSTAASRTANPSQTVTSGFSATKSHQYYSQANTQNGATGIYGEAVTKVN